MAARRARDHPASGLTYQYFDPAVMGPILAEGMDRTSALLFGRRTWQIMAAAWPGRAGDPFADRMNAVRKHCVSRTLAEADLRARQNTSLVDPADAIRAIRDLRASDGGDLQVMGSPSLAAQLVAHGLVDEYLLMVEPVLLGGGKRLFPTDGERRPLELCSAVTASTGVLVCRYRPAGE